LGAPGNYYSIIDHQEAGGDGWRLAMNDVGLLLDGGGLTVDPSDALLLMPGGFNQDEFYHIVVVYNGDGTAFFYVNGVLMGSDGFALAGISDDLLRIGNNATNTLPFQGLIDEVAIYGSALSAADIAAHYQNGFDDSNLVPVMGIEIDSAFDLPEPGTAMLSMFALSALGLGRRRRA
jgi:hypothetical protein